MSRSIASKTNPSNGKYAELADGIKAYFDMINVERRDLRPPAEDLEASATTHRPAEPGAGAGEPGRGQRVRDVHRDAAVHRRRRARRGRASRRSSGTSTRRWPATTTSSPTSARSALGCAGQVAPYLAQQLKLTKVGVLGYGVAQSSKLCAQGIKDSFEKYPTAEVVFYDDTIGFARAEPQRAGRADEGEGRRLRRDLHRHQRSRSCSPRRCRSRA